MERTVMSPQDEAKLKSANSMKAIRSKLDSGLKAAWALSLSAPLTAIRERFSRIEYTVSHRKAICYHARFANYDCIVLAEIPIVCYRRQFSQHGFRSLMLARPVFDVLRCVAHYSDFLKPLTKTLSIGKFGGRNLFALIR